MKIKKFNELFGASSITSSIKSDIKQAKLTRLISAAIGDIYKKQDCVALYNEKVEKFNNICDGIDYILDNVKSNSKKDYPIVEASRYLTFSVSDIAKDYGFEEAYIAFPENPKKKDNNFLLLISDTKYISKLKKFQYKK